MRKIVSLIEIFYQTNVLTTKITRHARTVYRITLNDRANSNKATNELRINLTAKPNNTAIIATIKKNWMGSVSNKENSFSILHLLSILVNYNK